MRQVMPHASTTLHQLNLLLINTDNRSVRVRLSIQSYHKTIGERSDLKIVADTGHRTSLRNDVTEMIEQVEQLLLRQRIGVLLFHTSNLTSQTMVHIFRGFLVDIPKGILQGIFIDPYLCG